MQGGGFVEENTQLTPRIVNVYRRANLVWLVAAVAAFVVAVVFAIMARIGTTAVNQASTASLQGEASRVATAIDASARAAHFKADAIAMTPMLRAAILTDAPTLADVVATEVKFVPKQGEMLEFFQVRGKLAASMVKVPPTASIAPVFGTATRLDNVGGGLNVVAAAPIVPQDASSELTGQIVFSSPVDLADVRNHLAQIASEAVLFGIGEPIVLVPRRGAGRRPTSLPVAISSEWKLGEIKLQITPRVAGATGRWIDPASYVAAGLGSLLLLVFFVGRRRA